MHEAGLGAGKKNCNCDKMRECVHMNMEIFGHDCLAGWLAQALQNAQALELIAGHMAYA